MKHDDKKLGLLGLAMRAGKLVTGEELTVKAIQRKEARLVLVASDASENTQEKMKNKCEFYKIPIEAEFSSGEISRAIGRNRSICAFTDKGFADSYYKLKGTSKI